MYELDPRVPLLRYKYTVRIYECDIDPYNLKYYIRYVARRELPREYFTMVDIGLNEINTLGRWLFGTPNYAGHYHQRNLGDHIDILLPDTGIDEVNDMILRMITYPIKKAGCKYRILTKMSEKELIDNIIKSLLKPYDE